MGLGASARRAAASSVSSGASGHVALLCGDRRNARVARRAGSNGRRLAECRIPDNRLVLAPLTDAESLVLDVGAPVSSLRTGPRLAGHEWPGVYLLRPFLADAIFS